MNPNPAQKEIIRELQQKILSMQGFRSMSSNEQSIKGLGPIEKAFPGGVFPIGAVHEFISPEAGDAAATNGFISGLLGQLMQEGGTALWVGTRRSLFPAALSVFGIAPERVIFIDLKREKDVLWTVEQALKCEALSAVVGELKELSFTESRRLQLAVEESRVTGFMHRHQPRGNNNVACTTRWRIESLASMTRKGIPGVGHPRWDVNLLRVRNGMPGRWQIEWTSQGFVPITEQKVTAVSIPSTRQTG